VQQSTTKALYSVHAWTGIITGLALFVVCFTGAVVVFKHELDLWANPSLRALPLPDAPAPLDTALVALQQAHPQARIDSMTLPGPQLPAFTAFARLADGERVKLAAHPETGASLGRVDSELGQFIRSLHVFLLFGPRWIVGFLGLVMLASIVTGVLIHQKILKDLYTQRWTSSLRLMLSDAHKLIGVWALLFHVLIAFTGAWLGLAPVVMNAARHLADAPPTAPTEVGQPTPPSAGAATLSLDVLRQRAETQLPGVAVQSVRLLKWDTPEAAAQFFGPARRGGGLFGSLTLRVADGHELDRRDPADAGFWARVNGWMEPLHFGDFGGLTLKWLYFILGLSPALLSLTGTWLWIERQQRGGPA
jgi:uncharacterized iron-regulated membrane protein